MFFGGLIKWWPNTGFSSSWMTLTFLGPELFETITERPKGPAFNLDGLSKPSGRFSDGARCDVSYWNASDYVVWYIKNMFKLQQQQFKDKKAHTIIRRCVCPSWFMIVHFSPGLQSSFDLTQQAKRGMMLCNGKRTSGSFLWKLLKNLIQLIILLVKVAWNSPLFLPADPFVFKLFG